MSRMHFEPISVLAWPWTFPLESKFLSVTSSLSSCCISSFSFLLYFFPATFLCDSFSLTISSHLTITVSISSLFCFQKCVLETKYNVNLKDPSFLLSCLLSLISHTSSLPAGMFKTFTFNITKVFLASLRQPCKTVRITAIFCCVQGLMLAALENNLFLCWVPKGIISQNVHLLKKCQSVGEQLEAKACYGCFPAQFLSGWV